MKKPQHVVISPNDLESLAKKLEKFSAELSGDESTMLSAMIVLAGKQLQSMQPEGLQINRDKDNLEGIQAGFNNAFSRFAPEAFPRPDDDLGQRIAAGTVCIE